MADSKALEKARTSLQRVQQFDVSTLPREAQLGEALNFKAAVEPASKIIDLFRQFPSEFLGDLPDNHLGNLTNQADGFHQLLTQIQKFDPTQGDPNANRNSLISSLKNQYQSSFDSIYHLISYGASRQRDFSTIERDFRAAMQRAEDSAGELMKQLQTQEEDGKRIIEEVRKVAAEQGASQQAFYFKEESGMHKTDSEKWRWYTIYTAIGLGAYAALSMILHKIPFLAPTTTYETIQLAISKVLIFGVLGYMLILCARNFLSHKHNEIVNRHRQNALLTFRALVEAAGSAERRDVILTYAAACIFSPQDTGYTRTSGESSKSEMPMNIIQAIPKLVASADK